ncbi:MAG: hypothetical protein PHP50_12445 [Lachnospiraceae bacterium]|nr:hypothetical protein [Lachnospiraceae bacterium]
MAVNPVLCLLFAAGLLFTLMGKSFYYQGMKIAVSIMLSMAIVLATVLLFTNDFQGSRGAGYSGGNAG